MTAARCSPPLVEVDADDVRALVAPLLGVARAECIERVERVHGGLVNTIFRVVPPEGPVLGVRICAGGVDALGRELRVLTRAPPALQTPRVVGAACESEECRHTYLVYHWVDGVTLNECRRSAPSAALAGLAEPIGRLAASVAASGLHLECDLPAVTVAASLSRADEHLRSGAARDRLGGPLADALRARLAVAAPRLEEIDRVPGVAHGDFGGRNVLVAPAGDDAWRVAGLIDWEDAFVGGALWDVGSLLRYARRYSASFRERFASGYRSAGGALPDGWFIAARLLDATRLVEILSSDRAPPTVHEECRDLLVTLVLESGT